MLIEDLMLDINNILVREKSEDEKYLEKEGDKIYATHANARVFED